VCITFQNDEIYLLYNIYPEVVTFTSKYESS